MADGYLERALEIAGDLKDEMFRLSVLNNLIVTFGQSGDKERATKYLELAAPLCNSYLNEPTFPVNLIMENSGPEGRPVVVEHRRLEPQEREAPSGHLDTSSRWIRRAHVPVRFSQEFEVHPDEVLSRDRTMMGVIASVFGNAGQRALAEDEVSKAKDNFLSALSIHEEIGDPQGALKDLERLTHIAYRMHERDEVCAHLRAILALAPVLQRIDPHRWKDTESETRDALREASCLDQNVADQSHERPVQ